MLKHKIQKWMKNLPESIEILCTLVAYNTKEHKYQSVEKYMEILKKVDEKIYYRMKILFNYKTSNLMGAYEASKEGYEKGYIENVVILTLFYEDGKLFPRDIYKSERMMLKAYEENPDNIKIIIILIRRYNIKTLYNNRAKARDICEDVLLRLGDTIRKSTKRIILYEYMVSLEKNGIFYRSRTRDNREILVNPYDEPLYIHIYLKYIEHGGKNRIDFMIDFMIDYMNSSEEYMMHVLERGEHYDEIAKVHIKHRRYIEAIDELDKMPQKHGHQIRAKYHLLIRIDIDTGASDEEILGKFMVLKRKKMYRESTSKLFQEWMKTKTDYGEELIFSLLNSGEKMVKEVDRLKEENDELNLLPDAPAYYEAKRRFESTIL